MKHALILLVSFVTLLTVVVPTSGFLITTGQAVASPSSPSDYRINTLVVDSHHLDTVYAGTPSGLFRTTDGGTGWKVIGEFSVNAIVLDPLASDVIYLGTDRGVFRSEDGGRSWSSASEGLSSLQVFTLALDPTGSDILYAGTEAGVFQSSDRGSTWAAINQGLTGPPAVWDLKVDPLSPERVFAVTSAGVFRTDNRGVAWKFVSERGRVGSTYAQYRAISIHPKKSTIIYLAASTGTAVWLFRSTDGGETWKVLQSGLPKFSTYYPSFALDPSDTSRVYVGHDTEGVFRSTDRGETWKPSYQGMPLRAVRAMVIDPTRPNILYVGTDGGGVYKTPDSGATWQPVNTGLIEVVILYGQVTDPDGRPLSNVDLYAYESEVAGRTGRARTGADGSYAMALFPGTYNVMVSFPAARGFSAQTFPEVVVLQDTRRDFAAESTVTLSGTILDPDGLPVNGAPVTISDAKTGAIAAQYPHTSFDGHYRVSVRPGMYDLHVDPPPGSRLLPQTVSGVVVARDTTVDITLERGLLLSGRITDPEGKPVAGAVVSANGQMPGQYGSGQTAADGSYRIALLPGTYTIIIQPHEGSGLPLQSISNVQITKDTTLDIMLKKDVILSGKVTVADGKPVAGAFVNAKYDGAGQTAADGSYRIALVPDTYTLDIQPPEGSALTRQSISNVEVTKDTTLDITLESGVILSGKVTDPEGKPVAEAFVSAYGQMPGQYGYGQTATDGSFQITLMPGTYTLFVEPPWGSDLPRITIRDIEVKEDRTLDIVLKGVILSGKVTDPEGNPVANVSIDIGGKQVQTSLDGTYRIAMEPGPYALYSLHVQPPEGTRFVGQTIRDVKVEADRTLDITLEVGFILSGRITDNQGKPVANVGVNAQRMLVMESWSGRTSSDGTYRLTLLQGAYTLEISPPEGSGCPIQSLSNVKVSKDTTLDITLNSGVILSGQITTLDGNPVAGVGISAMSWPEYLRGSGYTSAAGVYRIVLLPSTYTLEIEPPWNNALQRSEFPRQTLHDVKITKDTTLDITLKVGVTLSGRITDPEGKPVKGAYVSVFGEEDVDPAGWASTSEDGSYSIANLRPGTYRMSIYGPAGEFPSQIITDVEIIKDMTFNVTLKRGVILSGKVTDSDGKPVAGVGISAYDMATGQGGSGQTSTDGSFRVALMPGTYTLAIHPPQDSGFPSKTINDVQVKEGMNLDITLKVGKRFTISGRVTDSKGRAMADIEVIAHKQPTSIYLGVGQGVAGSKTANDGSYQLTLEEGKYDMTCGTIMGGESDIFLGRRLTDVDVSKDMTLNITIPTPDEAYEVRGVIKEKEGHGMNWAYISAYDKETGNFSWTVSWPGGIYLLVMAAGTYEWTLMPLPPTWQFPEQHIQNVVIEGNTIKNITIDISRPTAVQEEVALSELPKIFTLHQNCPNPFNHQTRIRYGLPRTSRVSLTIYNLLGQRVKTLVDERQGPGWYTVFWDGRDVAGREVASGVYFYRLEAIDRGFVETKRMVVVR